MRCLHSRPAPVPPRAHLDRLRCRRLRLLQPRFQVFFGALLGGVAALIVGFLQFWPLEISLLWVVAVLVIGQFIEGNFLSPKLVGHSIGLHPVFMMLALLGFSYVFGILGLILAVPLAATTGVLVRHGLARYLRSGIYLGQDGADVDG